MLQQFFPTWKSDRKELAQGMHVTKAKQYLSKISGNIRIPFASGEGFGDQMIVVNIIEQLYALGYSGVVEVIGDLQNNKLMFLDYESPLLNLMKLYQCEHLFIRDSLKVTLNGLKLHFYDADYFRQNLPQLPEVELAIYSGILFRLRSHYATMGRLSYFFTHQLTTFAKSKRALYLNPYTATGQVDGIGFISQLKYQFPKIDYRSHALSYPLEPPPLARVEAELSRMKRWNLPLSETLRQIVSWSAGGRINTFAIYALHHLKNPEYALINLVLGGMKANQLDQKPLLAMVMSPLSADTWHGVQQFFQENTTVAYLLKKRSFFKQQARQIYLFPELQQAITQSANKTFFIDASMNQTLPLLLNNQSIYVIRLPTLFWIISNYLSIISTYPMVYEGVNAANLLKNAKPKPKWGLPCPRMDYGGHRGLTPVRTLVADNFEIPKLLSQAGPFICPSENDFINNWQQFPTPNLKIAALITNYSHAERPPLEPGNSRVAYAIAEISEQKSCQLKLDLNNCELRTVLEHHGSSSAPLLLTTAYKGFGYGILESSTSYLLQQQGCGTSGANKMARAIQLLLQGILEGDVLTLSVIGLELVLSSTNYHTQTSQWGLTSLMFLMTWLPQLLNADFKTLLTMVVLTLVFVSAHALGRRCTQVACKNINKNRLFATERSTQKILPSQNNVNLSGIAPLHFDC